MAVTRLLEVPKEDATFFDDLRELGHSIEVIPANRQQGGIEWVDVIVTLSATLTPIISAYLARPSRPTIQKRVVIDGQRRVFENYSVDEIEKIIEKFDER